MVRAVQVVRVVRVVRVVTVVRVVRVVSVVRAVREAKVVRLMRVVREVGVVGVVGVGSGGKGADHFGSSWRQGWLEALVFEGGGVVFGRLLNCDTFSEVPPMVACDHFLHVVYTRCRCVPCHFLQLFSKRFQSKIRIVSEHPGRGYESYKLN